jgi:hypothetical protein
MAARIISQRFLISPMFAVAFDREYRLAYDRLDAQSMATLGKVDSPPSIASVFCRHFFRQLEL